MIANDQGEFALNNGDKIVMIFQLQGYLMNGATSVNPAG
jgi:hypothetical protein